MVNLLSFVYPTGSIPPYLHVPDEIMYEIDGNLIGRSCCCCQEIVAVPNIRMPVYE